MASPAGVSPGGASAFEAQAASPAGPAPSVLNVLMNENSFGGGVANDTTGSLIALIVLVILVMLALVGLCAVMIKRRQSTPDAVVVSNGAYSPEAAAESFNTIAPLSVPTSAPMAMPMGHSQTIVFPSERSNTLPGPAYSTPGTFNGGQSHAVASGAFKCTQCGNSYHYQTDLDQHKSLRHGL